MQPEEKKREVLLRIRKELAARGIYRQCPKCSSVGEPCAYPDFSYRDCPVKEERNYGNTLKAYGLVP